MSKCFLFLSLFFQYVLDRVHAPHAFFWFIDTCGSPVILDMSESVSVCVHCFEKDEAFHEMVQIYGKSRWQTGLESFLESCRKPQAPTNILLLHSTTPTPTPHLICQLSLPSPLMEYIDQEPGEEIIKKVINSTHTHEYHDQGCMQAIALSTHTRTTQQRLSRMDSQNAWLCLFIRTYVPRYVHADLAAWRRKVLRTYYSTSRELSPLMGVYATEPHPDRIRVFFDLIKPLECTYPTVSLYCHMCPRSFCFHTTQKSCVLNLCTVSIIHTVKFT